MKRLFSLLLMVVVVFSLVACQPEEQQGAKCVTFEIVYADEEVNETMEVCTDAEFLYDVLMENQEELKVETAGEESEFGAYLEGLYGYNFTTLEMSYYWSIYINDEYGMLGITTQPVADGDTYKFEATGY